MVQRFDEDAVRRLQGIVQQLQDGAFSKLPQALENIKDLAKESGSEKLIKSTEELADLANSGLLAAYDELMASVNKFIEGNKSIFNQLNLH